VYTSGSSAHGPGKEPDPQPSDAALASTGCLDQVGKASYQLIGQNLTGKQFITLMFKATSAVRQTSHPALHCRSVLLPTTNWCHNEWNMAFNTEYFAAP
jgi:hypothetical protein